ncbi:MAG TPA: hypothetical protein VKY73_18260 [Polyangiaceae bacterium]|nr:hypothetical protein [Polyangiaceae bacterium]
MPRPPLAKTRGEAFLCRRTVRLVKASDYAFRQLFEGADVMSEGRPREEADGTMYYGSTSILLPFASRGGHVPDNEADAIVALLTNHPHARIRAIRIACIEAQVRARAPLGRVRTESLVHGDRRGIRIDVEVEARVLSDDSEPDTNAPRRARSRAPRGA